MYVISVDNDITPSPSLSGACRLESDGVAHVAGMKHVSNGHPCPARQR